MPFAPGEAFERYQIEAPLGRGGMGEVYRALDTRLRRSVALKVIRRDKQHHQDGAARFFREARAAAALTHPNVVAVHDVGEAEGILYIVMELVVGQPLLAFVGDTRVSLTHKVGWLSDIARALGAAHRAGIIHRDVKPSNVMVSEEGFAKVLDFGLARPLGPVRPGSFRTKEGHVLGTLRYMAPELLAGADADARSDQYAFGITAYELLTGTHPGGALFDTVREPIQVAAPWVPPHIAGVIERTLAQDPAQRFAAMTDVVRALQPADYAEPHPTLDAMPPTVKTPSDPIGATTTKVSPPSRPNDVTMASAGATARETPGRISLAATLASRQSPSQPLRAHPSGPPALRASTVPFAAILPRTPARGIPAAMPMQAQPTPSSWTAPEPRLQTTPAPNLRRPTATSKAIVIGVVAAVAASAAFAAFHLRSELLTKPSPSPSVAPSASVPTSRPQ